MTADFSAFLLDDLLPLVEREYNISPDPDHRCCIGASSGGIAAMNTAWYTAGEPRGFNRVISHVGSFTNIRGGHNFPWLIRNTPRKPIRVFLQDGSNDLNNQHGSWPLANQVWGAVSCSLARDLALLLALLLACARAYLFPRLPSTGNGHRARVRRLRLEVGVRDGRALIHARRGYHARYTALDVGGAAYPCYSCGGVQAVSEWIVEAGR
jgi:hypothetical protein